jgi:hypothetical protein
MTPHQWRPPEQRRQQRALRLEASRLLAGDRKRRKAAPAPKPTAPPEPAMPKRLTLADLPRLRKKGLVP